MTIERERAGHQRGPVPLFGLGMVILVEREQSVAKAFWTLPVPEERERAEAEDIGAVRLRCKILAHSVQGHHLMPYRFGVVAVSGQRELINAQERPCEAVFLAVMFIGIQRKQAMGGEGRTSAHLKERKEVQLTEIVRRRIRVAIDRRQPMRVVRRCRGMLIEGQCRSGRLWHRRQSKS